MVAVGSLFGLSTIVHGFDHSPRNQWSAHGYGYGVYTDHNEWPVSFGLECYAPALNPGSPKMRPGDANLQSSWS